MCGFENLKWKTLHKRVNERTQCTIYQRYNGCNIQTFENGQQCTLKDVIMYVIASWVKLGPCSRETS